MKSVMNLLGIALIVVGIVAVVFMVVRYTQDEEIHLTPQNTAKMEAPYKEPMETP